MSTWIICSIAVGAGLLLLGFLCVLGANKRFNKLKNSYQKISIKSGITSTDLVQYVDDINELNLGVINLRITADDNSYSPATMTLNLSSDVIDSDSIYAVACTAHELGHAREHQKGSRALNLWYKLSIVEMFTSHLVLPFFVVGLIMSLFSGWVMHLGTLLMNLSTLFTICALLGRLITLPTEQHASDFGIKLLQVSQALTRDEIKKSEKLLNAALGTYIYGFYDRLFTNFKLIGKVFKKSKKHKQR